MDGAGMCRPEPLVSGLLPHRALLSCVLRAESPNAAEKAPQGPAHNTKYSMRCSSQGLGSSTSTQTKLGEKLFYQEFFSLAGCLANCGECGVEVSVARE
eukprot:3342551-Amphidinium_carterae.1